MRWVRIGVAVFALVLIVDGLAWWATAGREARVDPLTLATAIGLTLGLGALWGGIVASLLGAGALGATGTPIPVAARLREATLGGVLSAAAVVGACAIVAALVRGPLLRWPALAAGADLAFAAAGLAGASAALRRVRGRPLALGSRHGLVLLAVAVTGLAVFAMRRPELVSSSTWDLVVVGAALVASAGLALLFPRQSVVRAVRAVPVVAIALGLGALVVVQRAERARQGMVESVRPASWALELGARVDLDGDGYSALLGGLDCDDLRADVHPEAPEIPGNGVDENCRGGDVLARSPFAPRPAFVPLPRDVPRPDHLILLSVDALRADHLGAYGYSRPTSPNIDAFAARSVRFAWAYSSAPETDLAMPILLSGRSLTQIPFDRSVWPGAFPPELPTVASVARRAGYRTGAVVTHRYFNEGLRWTQGFEEVDRSLVLDFTRAQRQKSAHEVTNKALAWLGKRRGERTFQWMHVYDPHHAYVEREGVPDFGNRDVDRYDGEIAATDQAFGDLLRGIDRLGLGPSTAIVLLADHGEEFGEHGGKMHGSRAWQEILHVPLIVHVPGIAPKVVPCPTGHVDVPATLLNLMGVDAGKHGFSGATLVPDLVSGCSQQREVVSELRYGSVELRVLIGPRYKLTCNLTHGSYRLFDLRKDPNERHNLRSGRPRLFRRMQRRLLQWNEWASGQELQRVLGEAVVSALPESARPLRVRFGDSLELVGASSADRKMPSEEVLETALYWRVTGPMPARCRTHVRYVDKSGRPVLRLSRSGLPLSGVAGFETFPRGRLVEDVVSMHLRLRRRIEVRGWVSVQCGGDDLPLGGGNGGDGDEADLGTVRVGARYVR